MARNIKIFVAMWLQTITRHTNLAPNELCPVTADWPRQPEPQRMRREGSCTTGQCLAIILPWVSDHATTPSRNPNRRVVTTHHVLQSISPLTTCYREFLLLLSSHHLTLTQLIILSGGFCIYSQ